MFLTLILTTKQLTLNIKTKTKTGYIECQLAMYVS